MRCTCKKSSSTGVSRPKKDTSTRTLPFSGLIASTMPMKSVNGPSTTLTRSPLEKLTLTRGASIFIRRRIRLTSGSSSGLGCVPAPTKPVTPGVVRGDALVGHRHLNEHVPGEDLALHGAPLAVLDLDLLLGGDHDIVDLV